MMLLLFSGLDNYLLDYNQSFIVVIFDERLNVVELVVSLHVS